MRRLPVLVVLILTLALPGLATAGERDLEQLSGTWVLAEGEDSIRARIDQSIDGMLSQMDGVYAAFRWIAGPQLRKYAKVCSRYELKVEGDQFVWRCDDDGRQVRNFDKAAAPIVGEDGNLYDVSVALMSEGIRMLKEGVSGGERAVFQADDPGTLVVSKAMFSTHMPNEVAWSMTYRRIE